MTEQPPRSVTSEPGVEPPSGTAGSTLATVDAEPAAGHDHELLSGLTTAVPESRPRRPGVDWITFGITAALAIAFVVWGFVGTASLSTASSNALDWVMTNAGWAFVLLASMFVVFVLWLAASRYGDIPLGSDREEPEFSTKSWIAMMFSAGMGIGLMFYGTAEPLSHYIAPPPRSGVTAQQPEAVQLALATTLFHWTLHPWAIYAVVGVAIAYSTFRKGRSQLISSVFAPLIGRRRATGPLGRVIDILAIFATLFGSAASLGLGALQIGAGLQLNGWVHEVGSTLLVVIITVLTICFIASAVSGIARGVEMLSNVNMVLALLLAVFVFLVGPTLFILDLLPNALGSYVDQLARMASRSDASGLEPMRVWLSTWTVFYWAWWISWTPFVGMFIARISRGRTIRQFVTGVLLVPSLVSLVWFAIFGGAAIDAQRTFHDMASEVSGTLAVNADASLFQLLNHYPWSGVTTVLVMVLVAIFFVSGADAASIVMGTLSEHGTIEPTRKTVVFWGAATGAVAAVMLLAGSLDGDMKEALSGLQSLTIVSALPFAVVMAALCVALVKDLRTDPVVRRADLATRLVNEAVVRGISEHGHDELEIVVRSAGHEDEAPAPERIWDRLVGRYTRG
ncbi:BCCT family transporter [Arsenicicoccus sp. oral taxon 190]|uniref:BCCT family transporter n=1 Tax=Arsenicicoccus sp. oral taxon 190 TaxID=1658671 RepID=UPI0009E57846|nr:BCCT family transporter [Arsenicicoccus sp. oral taxon 190]